MGFDLTVGAVGKLLQDKEVDKPILQMLGFKKIAGQAGADRFRVNVSDGVHSHTYAMLATQLNHLIPDGKLDNNCIVRCDKVVANSVGEKRVLIILELELLAQGKDVGNRIGNPVQWTEENANLVKGSSGSSTSRPTTNGSSYAKPTGSNGPAPTHGASSFYKKTESKPFSSTGGGGSEYHSGPVVPIRDLNPYNSRCAIRARVTSKGDVRTWSNAKGEGKLFNIEILDDSGEIRMTGFQASVDQFYELLEVGSVYVFKNFQVKTANRAFNKLPHDYELSMGNDTQIIPYNEDTSAIPTASYNFVEIAKIEPLEKDSVVDVIGICKARGELAQFTSRAGKEMIKRDLVLVDKSKREITLTLWGKNAEDFTDDSQPVIVLKGARVGDFNGKTLSAGSNFHVNPDIPEAHAMRGWYDNEGRDAETVNLSTGGGPGGAAPWRILSEVEGLQDYEKGDVFMCKATVMSIRRDNPAYMSCPIPSCKKKIVDMGDGSYNCEKCATLHQTFNWRMMISVSFADFSGNIWATCFEEAAEVILGKPSSEIGPLHKENPDAFDEVIKKALFQSYILKIRSKMETYNQESRRKATVMELHHLNFEEYSTKLANELKESAY